MRLVNIRPRSLGAVALLATLAAALSGCGSSSSGSSSTSSIAAPLGTLSSASTITVLQSTAPDYLDPGLGYTRQAASADWLSYTGLLTYAHASGVAGARLIPGVATTLPTISPDAKTYRFTLREGLVYSDGAPVKASDVPYSIQRAIKLNWGGKSFFVANIVGASAFDRGKSRRISGITADDAAGTVTFRLVGAYGAFPNVLALPSAGLVPSGTALSNLSSNPPPGVGPYEIKNVVPNQSYSVVRNPNWTREAIPGIPPGHVDVNVKFTPSARAEAESVLNNQADVFDSGDQLPPALISQIQSEAQGRFAEEPTLSTYYFFLNTKSRPFSSLLARQAVVTALDRRALARLDTGQLAPDCHFLPVGLLGHPTAPCPYGDPAAAPNLAKAKQLVAQSGMAGVPVTVWGQTGSPGKEYVDYYASVLTAIGFKATERIITDAQYFSTIGNLKTNPQTGFADWNEHFPNPSDFYLLLDGKSIQATDSQNFSQVDDPHIQSELAFLDKVPTTKLASVASRWQKLDEYVAQKAYTAVYGSQKSPQFFSTRIDAGEAAFSPVYGNDWTTLRVH